MVEIIVVAMEKVFPYRDESELISRSEQSTHFDRFQKNARLAIYIKFSVILWSIETSIHEVEPKVRETFEYKNREKNKSDTTFSILELLGHSLDTKLNTFFSNQNLSV